MSIYWERCDICERHAPTSLVTFRGKGLRMCYRCSFLFSAWDYRGEPAWKKIGFKKEENEFDKKIRAIEKMLEEKKE
ncbi:MAG: hypothetical protein ACP5TH_01970 [Fervidicoccaceae archaeon]